MVCTVSYMHVLPLPAYLSRYIRTICNCCNPVACTLLIFCNFSGADLENGSNVVRPQLGGARQGDLHDQVEPQAGEEAPAGEVRCGRWYCRLNKEERRRCKIFSCVTDGTELRALCSPLLLFYVLQNMRFPSCCSIGFV